MVLAFFSGTIILVSYIYNFCFGRDLVNHRLVLEYILRVDMVPQKAKMRTRIIKQEERKLTLTLVIEDTMVWVSRCWTLFWEDPRELSLQLVPIAVVVSEGMAAIWLFFIDPNFATSLGSLVRDVIGRGDDEVSLGSEVDILCTAIDLINLLFHLAMSYYCVFFGVLGLQKLTHSSHLVLRWLREDEGDKNGLLAVLEATCCLREANLGVSLFNLHASNFMYLVKVTAIMVSIVSGFAAIKFLFVRVIYALFYAALFIAGVAYYCDVFSKSTLLPCYSEALKREILEKTRRLPTVMAHDRAYIEKSVKTIGRIELKIRGFNTVEREALLLFIDFVTEQIVASLLAFQI